ncbi:MAG TPA: ATPase, partial [Oceanicaulis sp.]|nr:ATPase [Oceanicaulis sp.]
KGGAGKSTVAIHLAVALMRMGQTVGVIDLDLRQASLTRHLDNRRRWADARGVTLPMPVQGRLPISQSRSLDDVESEERAAWEETLGQLRRGCDFIIVDSPGGDTHYARLAHASADTLITPINDSFVDFALLAEIDGDSFEVGRPSVYSEMVWECRKRKAMRERKSIDWLVMRNRISNLDSRNKRRVGKGLKALSERVGFRLAPGFSERVIYRE